MKAITIGMTGEEVRDILNNNTKVYNLKDYNCKCDGVTDDTVAFQALLDQIGQQDKDAVIMGSPGDVMIIGGDIIETKNTITYKSQICIPAKNFNDTSRISITIMGGHACPPYSQSAGVGSAVTPGSSFTIRSTLVLSDDAENVGASIICSRGPDSNYENFNYNQLVLKNIVIEYTADANNACTIGGLNMAKSATFIGENIVVMPHNKNLVFSGAPVNQPIGIHLPLNQSDNMASLKNCMVGGFYTGYRLADHANVSECLANVCINAYVFGRNSLLAKVIGCEANWCKNAVAKDDIHEVYADIQSLVIENRVETGYWYDHEYTVNDPTNLIRGVMRYTYHNRDSGNNDEYYLVKNGGANLYCEPIIWMTGTNRKYSVPVLEIPGTGNQKFYLRVRSGALKVDEALTATGINGVENTDWVEVHEF